MSAVPGTNAEDETGADNADDDAGKESSSESSEDRRVLGVECGTGSSRGRVDSRQ